MLFPLIFLYISNIKTASIPIITPPTNPMILIKLRSPAKKRIKGTKQVISQAVFFLIPISYQKIFFNVSPRAIKEVKVANIPKRSRAFIAPFPKKLESPDKADSVVCEPHIPTTMKIKKR